MKSINSIRWSVESIEHIGKHGVFPEEVEEVCFNDSDIPFIRSGRDKLHYVFGVTNSGRFLFIVVRFVRHGEVKVITARNMNEWERKYFRRRGK